MTASSIFSCSHLRRVRRRGTALIELVIGLIAIIAVFAVLLTIGGLGNLHHRALLEAREEAGANAMFVDQTMPFPNAQYIQEWDAGPDSSRYSRDDVLVPGNSSIVADRLAAPAQPGLLETYLPGNAVSAIAESAAPAVDFGLVSGYAAYRTNLLGAIRALVYDAETIEVEARVWMTWTRGLY